MTFAGILAFFGLAVVTMDVLGGVIAIGVMLRGGTVRHLLAFVGGYTVIIVAATLILQPLLALLNRWLRPLLESNNAIGAVEIVVGLARPPSASTSSAPPPARRCRTAGSSGAPPRSVWPPLRWCWRASDSRRRRWPIPGSRSPSAWRPRNRISPCG